MLTEPTAAERNVLGAMPYSTNHAQLHTDESVLPHHRGPARRGTTGCPTATTAGPRQLRHHPADAAGRHRRFLVTLGGSDLVDPAP